MENGEKNTPRYNDYESILDHLVLWINCDIIHRKAELLSFASIRYTNYFLASWICGCRNCAWDIKFIISIISIKERKWQV